MYVKPGSRRRRRSASSQEFLRVLSTTIISAALFATVFTSWEPASLRPDELAASYLAAAAGGDAPTGDEPVEASAIRIGVVSGHMGLHPDTGIDDLGLCQPIGTHGAGVNQEVAELVVKGLQAVGMEADFLEEFDDRLTGYRAVALVSIHADTCTYISDDASGYKVTTVRDTAVPDRSQRLEACVVDRYGRSTGLEFKPGSLTRDMTEYHTFYEIHSRTPAVIIETGFLYLDRDFLTEKPEVAASGIVDGILCYVNNEPIDLDPQE